MRVGCIGVVAGFVGCLVVIAVARAEPTLTPDPSPGSAALAGEGRTETDVQVRAAELGALPPAFEVPALADLLALRPGPWAQLPPVTLSGNPWPWAFDEACMARWDRHDWRMWAERYPWPLADVEYVIRAETGGTMDLCVVNRSSGASCWFQLLSGSDEAVQRGYLDPRACVEGAYRKWVDGGGSFERHWYRFWFGEYRGIAGEE